MLLTLQEKEKALRSTVAMPTADNWQLLSENADEKTIVIEEANAILLNVLEGCKASTYTTWGEIVRAIFEPMDKLASKYPDAGLTDSEASQTIALFFALNYDPAIFNFLRYREHTLHLR